MIAAADAMYDGGCESAWKIANLDFGSLLNTILKKRMIDVNISHLKNKCDAADTVEFLLTDCPNEC